MKSAKSIFKPGFLMIAAMLIFNPMIISATEITDETSEGEEVVYTKPAPEDHILKDKFKQTEAKPFKLLGSEILPGETRSLHWRSGQSIGSFEVPIPVIVVNGTKPGPVLCLTSAVHGDELNGIEIVRQVIHDIDPKKLRGTVVGVPVVNIDGFWRKARYIGDRRDLNRFFPGKKDGSHPSRVAYSLFNEIIVHCDALVDLHTGSYYRENLPQLRADITIPQVSDMVKAFGLITALQSAGPVGSLRRAATSAGIPAVVVEIGGPLSLEPEMVNSGVKSVRNLLGSLGMVRKINFWTTPQPVYYSSKWVRSDAGGILINIKKLGAKVEKGDQLGEIKDPITNATTPVTSPFDGIILGRAQNQFVSPGFALYHIGLKSSPEELEEEAIKEKKKIVEQKVEELDINGNNEGVDSKPDEKE